MLIVHFNPDTRSGHINRHPDVQVFSTSWFEWLENEAPAKMDFYVSDGQWDDDKLCSVERIDGLWYVKYAGFSRDYIEPIGPSTKLDFDNFWNTLQLVRRTARKQEGGLKRQF